MQLTGKGTGGVEIKGTGTNDDAPAGYSREVISANLPFGSATSLTTNVSKTVISIDLTPGDWDITATLISNPDVTTTTSAWRASISTVNNTLANPAIDAPFAGSHGDLGNPGQVIAQSTGMGRVKVSSAGNVTYYLIANIDFAVSTMTAYGFIWARRA
jgi:hypothetical protein